MSEFIKDYYSDKRAYFKKRIRQFFQDFFQFLRDIAFLLKNSFKEVLIFTLFCAITSMVSLHYVKNIIFDLIMKLNHTTYITTGNLKEVFTNPGSLLLFALLAVFSTFSALFEIAGLLHAFSMAQVGRDTNFGSMMAAGFRTCIKALNPRNWLVIIFIMILFPLTKALPVSSTTFKLIIPGFITQIIGYTKLYSRLYNIFYLLLIASMIVYIFSINIFVLQRCDFFKSCDRSRRLGKGHYITIFFNFVLMGLILNLFINSLASIIVINFRELISMFQKYSGVVSKSSEIGTYIYFLRQILKSLFSPAIYNAGLTVLFYRYIEEKGLMRSLSADTFKEVEITDCMRIVFTVIVTIFVQFSFTSLMKEYAFLFQPVTKPEVCAHRGDNVHAPENTMPAFELAAYENLPWVEVDVHQTADGVIVCNHDAGIERTTGVDLNIRECTYDELSQYEFGKWMPGDYTEVTTPKLEDLLKLAKENNMFVQVELKGNKNDVGFEENVLKVINDTLMHDDVMVICLDQSRLERIKQLDPDILTAYCMALGLGDLQDIKYSDNISIEENNVTPELVDKLHKYGKKVFCWTVDSEDTIQYLVSCDVDVIGTDNPMLVNAALDKVDYSGGLPRMFYVVLNVFASMEK